MDSRAPRPTPIALPTRDDPVLGSLSEPLGGPAGKHAVPGSRWWGPVRVALAVACAVLALGVIADTPCRADQWAERDRSTWTNLCYSDAPFLYQERGFADGQLPYRDTLLEYPVLTGAVMQASAAVARATTGERDDPQEQALAEGVRFYDVTAFLMALAALVTVVATAWAVRRRPWDAMLVAASPVLLLTATINWDLLPVAFATLAVVAWTRQRGMLAGILIGLGAAAKAYPVLLLGAMLLVALRSPERRRDLGLFAAAAGAAAVTWAVVNLPVYLRAREGWLEFFRFNLDRGVDLGSPWYAAERAWPGLLPEEIDPFVLGAAGIFLLLIVVLAMTAPEPPRLAQVAFLAVAAFVLVNKVWSPQYALWLLPLAVLARPRWRDLLVWQVAEVVYFVAVWWHLASLFEPEQPLIGDSWYALTVALRAAGLLWVMGVVARDMLRPSMDPVRPYIEPAPPVRLSVP